MDTKQPVKRENSNDKIWQILTFMMATVMLGYLGGWLAVRNSDGVTTVSNSQYVLQESELIADVAERVSPSVVSISVVQETATRDSFFFGGSTFESASEGTGIILNKEGLVVTNKHVIPETATSVNVVLFDGTEYTDVEVIGRDPFNDIAFLQIKDVNDLQPATLGDSSVARVGDKVIAIGNALGRFDTTVTSGIISGKGRPIVAGNGIEAEQLQNLLQTDTAINPGNSGGPLVNVNGEVIGINTAVSGEGQNIGFSIPINDVKPGITSVEQNGELIRPYLGVRYVNITDDIAADLELEVNRGAFITASDDQLAILGDSPAAKAGLQKDDVITMINDIPIDEVNPLVTTVSKFAVGDTISLTILRAGETLVIDVVLEAAPDDI